MGKFLLIFLLMAPSTSVYAEYFQGIRCSQSVSEIDGLILDSVEGANFEKKEYRFREGSIEIGKVKSNLVSYLFWKDKFFGIAIDVYKNSDYNEIIRFFEKNHGATIRSDKNRKLIWITNNEVIIVNRFTTHLAQVQIFCKELYDEMHGLTGE